MSLEERKEIYNIFCESYNFYERKVNSSKLESKRKLTKNQVFMIFANEEQKKRIIPIGRLKELFNIKSSYTIYCILKGLSYQDYKLEYDNLSQDDKNKIVSLLRNQ